MNSIVKYNKTAQYYFYLSNLVEWHFSCNPEYNKRWLAVTGPMSLKERKAIEAIKPMFEKYGFDDMDSDRYLGKMFIDTAKEINIWEAVKQQVSPSEFTSIQEAFEVFENRFVELWVHDKPRLIKIKQKMEKKLQFSGVQSAIVALKKIFNVSIDSFIVHLFVIPEESITISGGANTASNTITLELRLVADVTEGVLVMLHELSHHLLRSSPIELDKNSITPEVRVAVNELPLFREQGFESAWEELVICSLLPDGVLKPLIANHTKLNKPLSHDNRAGLEDFVVSKNYSMAQEYLNEGKIIDRNYTHHIIESVAEFHYKA